MSRKDAKALRRKTALLFIAVILTYTLLDLAFINLFAKDFIQKQVGFLLK